MATISSPGIGSGLDVRSIVSQLVALERRPITLLQETNARLTTRLSSFGLIQSYMGNLQSVAAQLSKATEFWGRISATSSDAASVGVSAPAATAPASYSIEVTRLASAQSLSTAAGAISNAANVGAGTLTITRGGTPVVIDVADGTSLAALREQINGAQAGVTAAIVQDSGGPRLVLTGSDSGQGNGVTIGVSGATGQLAALAWPGALTEDRPAADAVLKINGMQISAASNTLTNAVDGLTLTLTKTTTAPVQVSVGTDTAALRKGVVDFVNAYNEVSRYLSTQTRYDESSRSAGALQGDRAAIGLQTSLRNLVQQPSTASATYGRLSDLGLEVQRDGTIKINDSKLDAAMANPSEVAKAFSTLETGFGQRFKALTDAFVASDGPLSSRTSGLRESLRRNEKDQQRLEDRVARVQERITRQYSALDTNLNRLNGLSSYVQQQIANWNRSSES
jgi:flagellar hook-associated protein 2